MRRAETDSQLSFEAGEFVWSEHGLSEAHRYILPSLLRNLREAGAAKVLDLGCGNGALTHALAEEGFDLTGTDSSETGLAIARQNHPDVDFLQGDVNSSLPDVLLGQFDSVIAVEVVEHLLLPRSLFQRAREALRPRGTLIVTTPYHGYFKNLALAMCNGFDAHWHPLRDYGHVKFFSPSTLARLFQEQSFALRAVERLGRIPPLAKSMLMRGSLPDA
jgi:2-polyprenyl-6-hydroxyphenyl methylase/3-demethylubiquinone-9 3-methyltransferase